MRTKTKKDSYGVAASTVRVSVDVGLGQIGTISMFIDKVRIAISPAPVGPRDVGEGADLVDKLLLVEALVTDVSIMTNKMSVIVRLTGGTSVKKIVVTDEVDNEGDSMLFRVFVLFKD